MLDMMTHLQILGGIDLGGGTSLTKEQVGNALAIIIGIIALVHLVMGRIGKMFGFLLVAGFVWVVIGNPKGFLTAVGNLIKQVTGL